MIVTLGEIMLRLKAPGAERFLQTNKLESTFGGGEANVAVALSSLGKKARFVTALPKNDITDALKRELKGFGVDTDFIAEADGRLGIYFLEAGANQRPSKVIYDRAHSSISMVSPDALALKEAFLDASWFHITGITPALSESAAALSLAAVKTAKELGLTVSCDLNYRKNLWKYGKSAAEVMKTLMPYVDVLIANEEDAQKSLGIKSQSNVEGGSLDALHYKDIAVQITEHFPNVSTVAITLRESISADHNVWSACIYQGGEFASSKKYNITDIIDRVGGGDSFAAGVIYGLTTYDTAAEALEFAVAISCLKHSIPGDYCRTTKEEVLALLKSGGSGRISR